MNPKLNPQNYLDGNAVSVRRFPNFGGGGRTYIREELQDGRKLEISVKDYQLDGLIHALIEIRQGFNVEAVNPRCAVPRA